MSSSVRVVPWLTGACSLYAVVRDSVCLPDDFIETLTSFDESSAERLTRFLINQVQQTYIRQIQLRPERPELGVFAMYNHINIPRAPYNPSRLLCAYVGAGNQVLLVGAGFIKSQNEPIQQNEIANREAVFLGNVARELNSRISRGEITINGSILLPGCHDSLEF